MHALVTGATGLIGRALAKRLLGEGHRVSVLIRDEAKLESSLRARAAIYKADITDPLALNQVFSQPCGIETVFHVAACVDYAAGREQLFDVNAEGTRNLLTICAKIAVPRFIFISSIEAMGPLGKKELMSDELCACRPIDAYGESKLAGEKFVLDFGTEGKMQTLILRLGNVYGPGSLSFIEPLARAITKTERRYLFLNRNRYCWHPVYIDDAVEAIIRAALSVYSNEIYIVSGEECVTAGYLTQLIAKELGVNMNELALPLGEQLALNLKVFLRLLLRGHLCCQDERVHWAYSIKKAKECLGYSPRVNLAGGIAKTLSWAKEEGVLA